MLRFLARFLGVWLLAAALVVAVIDGAKSLAASDVVITDMAGALAMGRSLLPKPAVTDEPAPETPAADAEPEAGLNPQAIAQAAPAAPLLALAGLLCLIAGRRPRRHTLGREYLA